MLIAQEDRTVVGITLRPTPDAEPRTVQVLAGPTPTPGLVITPAVAACGFTGDWTITHVASGLIVPVNNRGLPIYAARRIATELGAIGVDWTADIASIGEQMKGKGAEFARACKRGRYPEPPAADADVTREDGPAPYPHSEAQATADAVARVITEYTLDRCAAMWDAMKRRSKDDPDGTAIDALNTAALLHGYGLVAVLRKFHDVDPDAADAAARGLWSAWEDGGTVHEMTADYANEYGIPAANPARRDLIPEHVERAWTAKLAEPLPYTGSTFEQLRQTIARTAYRGEKRFGELSDDMMRSEDKGAWPHVNEHLVAHGCTFYGWALLSILSLLGKEYPALARRVAVLVDDIGANGGCPHAEDIPYPPTSEPTTPAVDDDPDPLRCPTCTSPQPSMHPAVGGGGEVTHRCPDAFHTPGSEHPAG